MKRIFSSLRNWNYRLFWFGQLVSLAGTWMQDLAQAWLVLTLVGSPIALGTAMTIRFLPTLLLSLFGGIVADRFPKRSVLLTTQSVLAVQALIMAVLTSIGIIQLEHIYLLMLVRGVAEAVDMPAKQAFVVEMVGPEDVQNAVALNSTQFNVARIVGPALGGALIATIGIAPCFYLNAASFLAVLGALALMRPAELFVAPRRQAGPVREQLKEGLRYVFATPDVALILLLVGVIGTFGYNFTTMLPLLARYVLDAGPGGLGALMSALGVGSLLAAVGVAYAGRPTRKALLAGAAGVVTLLFLVGLSRSQYITMGLLVGLGMFGILFMTTANTRIQLISPDHLRGRVMALYALLFVGTTPIGSLLIGTLSSWTGVQAMVLEMASLSALGFIAAFAFAYRKVRAQPTPIPDRV